MVRGTARGAVVRQAKFWGQSPRYVFEPRLGQSCARNAGMAAAQGDVLLWTDDDVRPGEKWIEAMCRPILAARPTPSPAGSSCPTAWTSMAAAMAPGLPFSRRRRPRAISTLIGANMAFARRVLKKVPAFDPELGPGALGFGDDTLFSWQLAAAGFRIVAAGDDSMVEHHCGEDRLARSVLADVMARQGRSRAYIDYHWRHRTVWLSALRAATMVLRLCGLRLLYRLATARGAVIGRREARWLWRGAYYRQMAIQWRQPRHYTCFGLEKLVSPGPLESLVARPQRAA